MDQPDEFRDLEQVTSQEARDLREHAIEVVLRRLAKPSRLWSRKELAEEPPPAGPGVYGWYFLRAPKPLRKREFRHPEKHRVRVRRWLFRKWTLLYVGKHDQDLGRRIVDEHFDGELVRGKTMSTMRMSLGCVLASTLGLALETRGKDGYTWGIKGEEDLSGWLCKHARVAWSETGICGDAERRAIKAFDLPLNRQGNEDHPFHDMLGRMRSLMKRDADSRAQTEYGLQIAGEALRNRDSIRAEMDELRRQMGME